jgi:cyanophycinase-like exopeptidase
VLVAAIAASIAVFAAPPVAADAGSAAATPAARHHVLIPIGGDYSEPSLEGFLAVAASRASGPTLDVLVVPAAYGHTPNIHANVRLALKRTRLVDTACQTILPRFPQLDSCSVSLVKLFVRRAASRPANVARFLDPGLDAAYFLGGIQGIAMHILGRTPVEKAMARAYAGGVVFGGTSAGDAVLSHTMIEGFAHGYGAENELQRSAVLIDWADSTDPRHRGLTFGSDRAIFDEHYDQRGRFGRLVNIVAQSADHFGGPGRVGLGVNYRTGATVVDDSSFTSFGKTSTVVIDFGAAGATHTWSGPDHTLSARNVVTDLIAPGRRVRYDIAGRVPWIGRRQVSFVSPGPWPPTLHRPAPNAIMLGGNLIGDPSGPAMRAFVAHTSGSGPILAVFAAYPGKARAAHDAAVYRQGLTGAGWAGRVDTFTYGRDHLPTKAAVSGSGGVIVVGGDQSLLSGPLADGRFRRFVRLAAHHAPVTMTDGAMTAAAGTHYVANPDPTSADIEAQAMASFRTHYNRIEHGLRLIDNADFEPALTGDYRWGRLYALARTDPQSIVFGVCGSTAIVLDDGHATVAGTESVVSVDARTARFLNGDNGALTALNVVMDFFASGETLEG